MKNFILVLFVMLACSSVVCAEYVHGYYKKNGTYVNGYNRSSANDTVKDNYSYKGNYNPYTYETGTNKYKDNKTSDYYDGWYR